MQDFESKDYIDYLGVLLDRHLSIKTVGLITKLRLFIPGCILLNIYQSLIYSFLYNDVNATRAVIGRCP